MGYQYYRNKLRIHKPSNHSEELFDFMTQPLQTSSILPRPLGYKDIDIAFKDWVEKDLKIVYEGDELTTIALFSNQRFSEYMQSWQNTDDDKNLLLNFKVITRESNPSQGTMLDGNMNIPGNRTYLMKKVIMEDPNGRPYILEYRMKHPYCIDLNYTVSVVTNKYNLINEFNMLVNDKFKAIQCYISPNGYYIPMKLENISDESEYNLNDRQFFSQSFEITAQAFILSENDFIVEEKPIIKLSCISDGSHTGKSSVEMIEDDKPICPPHNPYYYQGVTIEINVDSCEEFVDFTLPIPVNVLLIETENILSYKISVDREERDIPTEENPLKIKKAGNVKIFNIKKKCKLNMKQEPMCAFFKLIGYNPTVVFDENLDNPESELDITQKDEKFIINN